jgi:hypothetical protein
VEWDFDNDLVVDMTGDPVGYVYPSFGTYSANVQVSDNSGCQLTWIFVGTVVVQCPVFEYSSNAFTDCGNADGVIDPEETVDLNVTVQNTGNVDAFNMSGILSTATPGITIPINSASFPDIPTGLTGASLTPFQFIVDAGVPCGTVIDFTLDLTYEDSVGNPFSNSVSFQLQVGSAVDLLQEDFNSGLPGTWMVVDGGSDLYTWTDWDPCVQGVFPDMSNSSRRRSIAVTQSASPSSSPTILPTMGCSGGHRAR